MKITFTPEKNVAFVFPEGTYTASFSGIKRELDSKFGKPAQVFKLVFKVENDNLGEEFVAIQRIWCPLESTAPLRRSLEKWLGKNRVQSMGDSLDTTTILGESADIVIRHYINEGFSQPFVAVESVHPPGTLTSTFKHTGEAI
jgi:hypothetical protein